MEMMYSPKNIFSSIILTLLMKDALCTLCNFNYSLLDTSNILTQTLLFGNMSLSPSNNFRVLNATIEFVLQLRNLMNSFFK